MATQGTWPWGEIEAFGDWLRQQREALKWSERDVAWSILYILAGRYVREMRLMKQDTSDSKKLEVTALANLLGPITHSASLLDSLARAEPENTIRSESDQAVLTKELVRWRNRLAAFSNHRSKPNDMLAEIIVDIFSGKQRPIFQPLGDSVSELSVRFLGNVPSTIEGDPFDVKDTIKVSPQLFKDDANPPALMIAVQIANRDLEPDFFAGEIIVFRVVQFGGYQGSMRALLKSPSNKLHVGWYSSNAKGKETFNGKPIDEGWQKLGVAVHREFTFQPFSSEGGPFQKR